MDTGSLERSIWIAAPRERVWQAVTEPTQIPHWFLPGLPGAQMTLDGVGTLSVSMGPMNSEIALFEALESPRQVTSRTLPDRLLATTFTLTEENGGTCVKVTMTGFDALAADARQDRLKFTGLAWDQTLANLKAYLDGAALPFPQAQVAPLFGYWREPKKKLATERSIWIAAPRERVWRAITDPNEIAHWFSPGTEWGGTELAVGGRIFIKDPETGAETHTQVVEVVDPPYQLVTSSLPEPPATPETTMWMLTEENGGTRVTLTYTGYELMPEATRLFHMEQNTFGFGMMLRNLKAQIEGESLPYPMGF